MTDPRVEAVAWSVCKGTYRVPCSGNLCYACVTLALRHLAAADAAVPNDSLAAFKAGQAHEAKRQAEGVCHEV